VEVGEDHLSLSGGRRERQALGDDLRGDVVVGLAQERVSTVIARQRLRAPRGKHQEGPGGPEGQETPL